MSVVMEVDVNCSKCNQDGYRQKVTVKIMETQFYWIGDCPICTNPIIRIQKGFLRTEDYKKLEEME